MTDHSIGIVHLSQISVERMVNNLLTKEGKTKLKGSGDSPGLVDYFTSINLCLIRCSSLVIHLLTLMNIVALCTVQHPCTLNQNIHSLLNTYHAEGRRHKPTLPRLGYLWVPKSLD